MKADDTCTEKGSYSQKGKTVKVGKKYKNLLKIREIDEEIARKSSEEDFHIQVVKKGK